jgi:hypothetical protein
MAARQQDLLRLQPHMIPALAAAFSISITQLDDAVLSLRRRGYLPGPWLGDEASASVATHYTRRALDEPTSSYHSLTAYRDELDRVHDTLRRMEDDYRRTEGDNAARWGRRL